MSDAIDCLIVGAGHCGLLCARMLQDEGVNYRVVDACERVGDIWRRRPKNLRLFTSRQFCGLGDIAMTGDPTGFSSGREFADHLERFANTKGLRVSVGTRVVHLVKSNDGFSAVLSSGEIIKARCVINATGSNQEPIVPDFASKLSQEVLQATAHNYTSSEDFAAGLRIGVVGDGASGRQIAHELSASHQVMLARGRARKLVPNTVLGRDVFWWLSKFGILDAPTHSTLAKLLRKSDPIPAAAHNNRRLMQAGVQLRGEAIDADGTELRFKEGAPQTVDVVIWCVGYRERLDWVGLPAIRTAAPFAGSQGRTPEPGFFVVGRKWLTCRASELVLGAEKDAARVVADVCAFGRQTLPAGHKKRIPANV